MDGLVLKILRICSDNINSLCNSLWRVTHRKQNLVSPCLGGVCIKLVLVQNKKELCANPQAPKKAIAGKFKKAALNASKGLNLFNHA